MATQMLKIENTQCNVSAVMPVSCSIGDEKETRIELRTIEREVEERVHTILHELEAQLKGIFGTQPQISQSVAEAKKKVSAITTPIIESVEQNPTEGVGDAGISDAPDVNVPSPTPSSASTSFEDHPTIET